MIDFQFINQKKISLKGSEAWIEKIITYESKKLGEITFVFCDDAYLLEKNIKFLSHNSLTDVITFDYCENNNINGDVFISIDRVKENANEFKETFLNIISFKNQTIIEEIEDIFFSFLTRFKYENLSSNNSNSFFVINLCCPVSRIVSS